APSPDNPGPPYAKGRTWHATGDPTAAIAAYDAAIKVDAAFAKAWKWKGRALAELKRVDEAVACYDQALTREAGDHELWTFKGQALVDKGDADGALACFDRSIAVDRNNPVAWLPKRPVP